MMDRLKHRQKPGATKADDDANPAYKSDAKFASFFYMDRFITVCMGKQVLIYNFAMADSDSAAGDIERLKKNHK